jgi:hypothetical protein
MSTECKAEKNGCLPRLKTNMLNVQEKCVYGVSRVFQKVDVVQREGGVE